MDENQNHPCLSCGACCAYFRVTFEVKEIETGGPWKVPKALTEGQGGDCLSMKGTTHKHRPSCVALAGEIGKRAWCSIYENRPTPCRLFTASYEDGRHWPRCDEARKKHGLRPLGREAYPITLRSHRQKDPNPAS